MGQTLKSFLQSFPLQIDIKWKSDVGVKKLTVTDVFLLPSECSGRAEREET